MKIDFIRFEASDEVELQGWLSIVAGDTAVVHIHGKSGNGYENSFLDNLRAMYSDAGITFLSIDNRGRGIISDFKQGEGTKHAGSCFELFDESVHDIEGAFEYLRSVGKTKFIIQGHSLGCTKAVNYLLHHDSSDVIKAILLAPTDMSGWANTEPRHQEYLEKATQLNAEGKGEELVAAQCWLDHTPLSAQTYPTICEVGSSADIYGSRDDGALLGRVELPMLIAYGDDDIGIVRIDGSIDKWLERVRPIINQATSIEVVNGATHGFDGYETQLTEIISRFVEAS